jgi:membrane protease YdiL (CAAX protease family)
VRSNHNPLASHHPLQQFTQPCLRLKRSHACLSAGQPHPNDRGETKAFTARQAACRAACMVSCLEPLQTELPWHGSPAQFLIHGFMKDRLRCWIAVGPALVIPALGALAYFVLIRDPLTARIAYTATKLFTVAWPMVAWFLILRNPSPALSPLQQHLSALPLGAGTGLFIGIAIQVMATGPFREILGASAPAIRAKARLFGVLEHYWLFAATLSMAHSLVEEYYWRWFVYGRLRVLIPGKGAHFAAGAAFALHHIVVASVYFGLGLGMLFGGSTMIGGIIWSSLYARHGTLAGAWLSHVLVDMSLMWCGYRLLFGQG